MEDNRALKIKPNKDLADEKLNKALADIRDFATSFSDYHKDVKSPYGGE